MNTDEPNRLFYVLLFFVGSCIPILAIDARIAVVSLVIVVVSGLLLPYRLVSIEVPFMLNVVVVFFILLSHQICVLENSNVLSISGEANKHVLLFLMRFDKFSETLCIRNHVYTIYS